METRWFIVHYKDLSLDQFHDILALRVEVFIIEQDCPYQEVDGKDKEAFHVFALDDQGTCLATARILPEGVSYTEPSIGRVAVKMSARGTGIGHELMKRCNAFMEKEFVAKDVRISAQTYLKKYYEQHGFEFTGKSYLEDNIPHIEMLKRNEK